MFRAAPRAQEAVMRKCHRLHRWDAAVAAYLSSRRALGRAYRKEERVLTRLRTHLASCGAMDLDQPSFDQWRRPYRNHNPNTRLVYEFTVYNFCRYRRRGDPHCFLPDRYSLARPHPHPLPTLIEPAQVWRLLSNASALRSFPRSPLRPATVRLAIVLLYTAGLRIGEAHRLTLADVDEHSGVLRIRESKYHKSRWVPLSRSTTAELRQFLKRWRVIDPHPDLAARLLCASPRRPYSYSVLGYLLRSLIRSSKIWREAPKPPRIQDFRHSFAVAALLRWYQTNADVQSNLPKLAMYMGHVSIVSTAYYLRYMPMILALAGERFAGACGELIDEGVQ
jgi:integrase/recombinase XerD